MAVKALPLKKNFSWALAGNLFYAACQWVMLMALTKLATPEGVGQFGLGLALTAPILMFTNLQLHEVQATDAKGEFRFGNYVALRLVMSAVAFALIGAIVLWDDSPSDTSTVVLWVGVAKVIESLSDVFHGRAQALQRMDRVARSLAIKGPLGVLAVTAGALLSGSVVGAAQALAVAWLVVLVVVDLRTNIRGGRGSLPSLAELRRSFDRRTLVQIFRVSFPLGLVMSLLSLMTNIPRYFLEAWHGEASLGIFVPLAYVMVVGMPPMQALGRTASPRLASLFARGELRQFLRLLSKLLVACASLSVAAIVVSLVWGGPLLTLIYSARHAEQLEVFAWLMAAAGAQYISMVVSAALTATRSFKQQAGSAFVVALIALASSAVLAPHYGLLGAAWSMCITYVARVGILSAVLVRRILERRREMALASTRPFEASVCGAHPG